MDPCLRAQTDLFNWNDYYWAANVLLAEVTDGGTFHQQACPASPLLQADTATDYPVPHVPHLRTAARKHVWQNSVVARQSAAESSIHGLPYSPSFVRVHMLVHETGRDV